MQKLLYQKIHPKANKPTRQHETDAGFDVTAAIDNPIIIPPQSSAVIGTGLKVQIEENSSVRQDVGILGIPVGLEYSWVIKVCSRSGMAAKHNVFVLNAPGIVDSGYTGELRAILYNAGDKEYVVECGDKIAQLLIQKVYVGDFELGEIGDTDRGEKGFGSSGR